MSENIDDEVTLGPLLDSSLKLAIDIDSGVFSTLEIQDRIKQGVIDLERLTIAVNKLALFSSNELIEDVPTDSLQFLLIPCFLGVFHQNTVAEPMQKLEELRKAKVYYKNFLERLRNLTLIEERLSWEEEDEGELGDVPKKAQKLSAEEARRQKLERHRRKKELKENEAKIRKQLDAVSIDDGNLRDLYITQLKFWVERSFEEINSIEEELPLLKMMADRAANPSHQPPKPPQSRRPMKPFVITRDAQQKQVFGLGYPGVPTLTVDEWYHQKFGCGGGPASAMQQPPMGGEASGEHQSSDEEEANDEEKRQKAIRYDEYKDTHRRGWGNTHNKG